MNITRIRVVVAFAILALSGILFLQGFWILKSWQTHLQNYNHRVHQAAVHTANRLEKGHVRRMLRQHRKKNHVHRNHKVVLDVLKTDDNSDHIENKIIIINGDTISHEITAGRQWKEEASNGRVTWKAQFDELSLEEYIDDSNLLVKIKHLPIDSIVAKELGKEEINYNYSYEILTSEELGDEDVTKGRQRNRAVVPLFRSTLKDQPVFLKLTVDKHQASIPGWFLGMVGLSILFSGVMIWAFWYVVSGLLKQKRISEIKTDFINNMTHEFKTPISTISLAVDSISHEKVINDTERISYYSSIIKQENKRMNKQVERVLQAAQLEKGKLILNKKKLNIVSVLRNAIKSFDLIIEEKGGEIVFDNIPEELHVLGDEDHLFNVFNNIIDNAIKYSKKTPQIRVEVELVGKVCSINFKDNGIGLSSTELKHLFSRFYRAKQGDLHDVKGFGLGLNYVKYVLEAHEGSIDVHSKLANGSDFKLSFPVL